jgi:lipopolysaccharide cholinephosphotransferase
MICKTYIKIKAFLGISFVLFSLISDNGYCASNKIIYLNKQQTLAYYQMMKDINELFEKFEITFWPIAGTLLGAVRNGGLIPWDVDMDIGIFEYDT